VQHVLARLGSLTFTLAIMAAAEVAVAPSIAAAEPATICAIQGDGSASPLIDRRVTTTGVVYAVDDNGVWIQDPGCDADPATSDGIFAFRARAQRGDEVAVSGTVIEFFGLTEIKASTTRVTGAADIPAPTVIDERRAGEAGSYETLEGMRVLLRRGQTYVGTNRFGETFLVPGTTQHRVRRDEPAPQVLALDDGLPGVGPINAFAFDRISGAQGPLAFGFDNYKLQVANPEEVRVTDNLQNRPKRTRALAMDQSQALRGVATWNLFNVFDEIDDGGPATPELSPAEQELKRAKVAHGLVDQLGTPAVVGVQEVEKRSLLEAIATETNRYAASQGQQVSYEAVLLEGNDPRGIDVGFLLDTTRVEYANVRQLGADARTAGPCAGGAAGDLVYDRVPLAVDITPVGGPRLDGSTTVVVNHFKSKFGGTPENDFFEPCRVEQAQVLRENVAGLNRVMLIGDFNAFRDSPTLAALTAGGYPNTVDEIPRDRRFSYVFQGRVQFLDHIVVSPEVARDVVAVDSPKLDSDVPFPRFEDDPGTGFATSDHDPLISILRSAP